MKKEEKQKQKEIIKTFLSEMSTQDNRGTAFPFFYVIKTSSYTLTSSACSEKVRYWDDETCEFYESPEQCRKHLVDNEWEAAPIEYTIKNLEEFHMKKIWKEDGMFLTEKDAVKHFNFNRHHYSADAYTYVKHAWRAPELRLFLNTLFEYFNVEKRK